jgi:non-heme chloroperoxidase
MSGERFVFKDGGPALVGERWDGRPERTPVVLAHGGGQTRHSWQRTGERLARRGHAVIAYDARGHGESEWDAGGDYSLDAYAADLLGIARLLARPPVLVGASLGGNAALVVAGQHPEAVGGLVLVDVVVEVEPAGVARIQRFMRAHAEDGFESLDEVATAVAAYNPLRDRPRDLDGLRKNVRRRRDGRWYWHWDPAILVREGDDERAARSARLRAAAERVVTPTLVVRGGRSDVVTQEGVRDTLALIPTAEALDVAGAGHMVAGDENDAFSHGIETFLARLDA